MAPADRVVPPGITRVLGEVMTGVAYTVAMLATDVPLHPPAAGVIVYVAVPPLALVRVCCMLLPLPDAAPPVPDCETVQL